MIKNKIVAIDFDGTITDANVYPKISKLRKGAKETINNIAKHNTVCIWICREGRQLIDAYNFLNKHEITFHHLNASPMDRLNKNMRKIIADYYIDDHNIFMESIDWEKIDKYFSENE